MFDAVELVFLGRAKEDRSTGRFASWCGRFEIGQRCKSTSATLEYGRRSHWHQGHCNASLSAGCSWIADQPVHLTSQCELCRWDGTAEDL